MTPEDFVATLSEEIRPALEALAMRSAEGPVPEDMTIAGLLRLALGGDFAAAELAAAWMLETRELDAKLALARLCGDEARHYRWIEERLREIGFALSDFDPAAAPPGPLSAYLRTLRSTVERAAAGLFARAAVVLARNEVFAAFCDQRGDFETAKLVRERIQPDEQHHHVMGRRLLTKYAATEEAQARARTAAKETLRLAAEAQERSLLEGISRVPGC